MRELLQKLLDQRARAVTGARDVYERMSADGYEPTAEDHQELERRNAELDDLDLRIGQINDRIRREASAEEARAEAEQFIRPEREREAERGQGGDLETRVTEWARGKGERGLTVNLGELRTERNEHGVWQVRDLTKGSATAGGNTVPTSFRRSLYEHLIENSAIRQTRAEVITTGSGEALILPKTTAHPASGTITSEGAIIVDNDPTFGQGTLDAYKYTSLVQVSSELLQDTAVDLLGYLARAFGRALGNGSGAHFITGTGSSQPNGVITAGSIMVTGATGLSGVPRADDLIDLYYAVKEPYANNGEWLMRRATVGSVRKLKDDNGQYLWQPALTAGAPDLLLGRPIVTDPNVPATAASATSVAFGDFSAYKIRDVGAVRFERSDDFDFDNDIVTFRAILRTDGDLLDTTGAIGTYKGATA